MKLTWKQKWFRTIAWLRREFPARLPVRVRSVPLRKHKVIGWTYLGEKPPHFRIDVDKHISYRERLDTLLHEWAHVLTWYTVNRDDHGGEWGVSYARIYSEFCSWNYGLGEETQ